MHNIKTCLSLLEGLGEALNTIAMVSQDTHEENIKYTTEKTNIKENQYTYEEPRQIHIERIEKISISFGDVNITNNINYADGGGRGSSHGSCSDESYWIKRDIAERKAMSNFYKING